MGKAHLLVPRWIKEILDDLKNRISTNENAISTLNSDLQVTNVKYKDITLSQCTIPAGKSVPVLPTSGGTEVINSLNAFGVKILTPTGSYDDGYLGANLGNNGYVHIVNIGSDSRTYTKITVRVFYT